MSEYLKLQRFDNTPWGFRLTGGLDFGTPLTVIKVTGGSIAELSGVQVGDLILEINGQSAKHWTHTDAQNCILQSGDLITLSILRGSEVTPPGHTPLPEMTPANVLDCLSIEEKNLINDYLQQDQMEYINNEQINLESDKIIREMGLDIDDSTVSNKENQLNGNDVEAEKNLTDFEIAELLSGNEEVLDEGVLGINFKKFHPKVDFIRHSEVFKVLQNGNTHKEIPEEVQLKKDPTKRFSTFLQKPKPPTSPKPTGPYWHYPKPPRYLPRESGQVKEEPVRRKIKEKVDPGHSVLWLFLEETGDVIDERWGTQEEEIINLSRNTNRSEDEWAKTGGDLGIKGKVVKGEAITEKTNENNAKVEIYNEEKVYTKEEIASIVRDTFVQQVETRIKVKSEVKAEIQNYCEETRGGYKIEGQEEYKKVAQGESKGEDDNDAPLVGEVDQEVNDEVDQGENGEVDQEINGEEDQEVNGGVDQDNRIETDEREEESQVVQAEELEEGIGGTQIFECSVKFEETTVEKMTLEAFKKGEFKMSNAAKKRKKPLTPQARPIVLPGGRMWRNPKDAAFEEFYQGILIEQADVLVGTDVGVNFRKYIPPKFDVGKSAVCKLIRELEKKSAPKGKPLPEDEYYQAPISKRHFYMATLPQPVPVGVVDLKDLGTDI